jgi:hypothetical protein
MECGLGIPAIDSLADTGSIVTATWSHPFRHALPRGFSVVDWFRAHIGNRSAGTSTPSPRSMVPGRIAAPFRSPTPSSRRGFGDDRRPDQQSDLIRVNFAEAPAVPQCHLPTGALSYFVSDIRDLRDGSARCGPDNPVTSAATATKRSQPLRA